jgi:hypothetical protein
MGFVPFGGYVITTTDKTYVGEADVTEEKLKKIAEILGIPAPVAPLISQTRSIYVYRGKGGRPSKPRKTKKK